MIGFNGLGQPAYLLSPFQSTTIAVTGSREACRESNFPSKIDPEGIARLSRTDLVDTGKNSGDLLSCL